MMRVERITTADDNRPIMDSVNEFFAKQHLCKDGIVNIHMDNSQGFLAFYVFYDDGE